MRNALNLLSILMLLFVMQRCSQDDAVIREKSSTTFVFSDADLAGSEDMQLPENTRLRINIETASGTEVLTNHIVRINKSDNGYETESLAIPLGDYVLTSFEIVNEDELLYLTPNKGTSFDKHVKQPLPLTFSSGVGGQNQIHVQVLKALKMKIAGNLQLAVYVPRDGKMKLVSSTAHIISDGDTLASYSLAAKINKIPFTLNPHAEYTLVIIKDGYARDVRQFIFNKIKNMILKISLEPALTMLGFVNTSNPAFQFILESGPGTVDVDWGDGSSGTHTFTAADYSHDFEHTYAVLGNHFITVTGDLDQVHFFYSFYGNGMMDKINLEHLTELTEIRLGLTRGPAVINLSQNSNMNSILVAGIPQLRDLILPSSHQITYLDISGPNIMNMPEVSGLVNNMHTNALDNGITNGFINVSGSWWNEPGSPLFVGPPSAAAKIKLKDLRDNHGWNIQPSF